jgi:hypothetical protein
MKYMLLIYQGTTPTPGTDDWEGLSEQEKESVYAGYQTVNQTKGVTPGLGLMPPDTATTVRVANGKVLTDEGPYDGNESVGGYLVYEAEDFDAAIDVASRIPAARMGGAVEVRTVAEW